MQSLTFKLKQASAVLGVPPKDLQNLVQLGILRPVRRNRVCWFDANLLLQAKVAFYLKEALGSSSDLLARFTAALSNNLDNAKMAEGGASASALARSKPQMPWKSRFRCAH
jgi:hypothetical protein